MNVRANHRIICGVFVAIFLLVHVPAFGKKNYINPLPPPLPESEARAIIRRCAPNVGETTMQALTLHESRWRPFTIAINSKQAKLSRQPDTRDEAIAAAKMLLQKKFNFDMGFAQINSANLNNPILQSMGITIENIFDTCVNVRAGAAILTECYVRASHVIRDEQRALHAALSCYNTGNFTKGFHNGYVRKVYSARRST